MSKDPHIFESRAAAKRAAKAYRDDLYRAGEIVRENERYIHDQEKAYAWGPEGKCTARVEYYRPDHTAVSGSQFTRLELTDEHLNRTSD